MDTRHHKTLNYLYFAVRILQPVVLADGKVCDVEFTHQGDMLRGDPIYLQTSGPPIPNRWWDCDPTFFVDRPHHATIRAMTNEVLP
jgi:hypothetical protein